MAPIFQTAACLIGAAALVSGKPFQRRQEETTETSDDPLAGLNTDTDFWCTGRDLLDEESMRSLWYLALPKKSRAWTALTRCYREDDIPDFSVGGSIGDWLSRQAEFFVEEGMGPNDGWADNIMLAAQPDIGNNGLSGCGVIGSQCDPQIDCVDWASRGFGQ